eukprot:TRINITY_DN1668_c0_g2_i2.p1 TRINITY_DN1668_c0_g2~~TRINITY_DN1668_c0_g2_i2.p1  ORF type:complete len:360 (+),score=34.22 TRINITY_DN1668_c0_g2_i2:354-1433(+)
MNSGLPITSYGDVGEVTCGQLGRWITNISVYTSLVGVVIVYLILAGEMIQGVLAVLTIPTYTLICGFFVFPLILWLQSMEDVVWLGIFAVITQLAALIIIIVLCSSSHSSLGKDALPVDFLTGLINGFSIFTFALGSHSIFPTFYFRMKNKNDWGKVVNVSWAIVGSLYLTLTVSGYYAFGNKLNHSQILQTLLSWYKANRTAIHVIRATEILVVVHLFSVIPIFIIPLFLAFEARFGENMPHPRWTRYSFRTLSFIIIILSAVFLPYFSSITALISDISMSLTIFILPCVFYWQAFSPSFFEKVLLFLCILLSLLGSFSGLYLNGKVLRILTQNCSITSSWFGRITEQQNCTFFFPPS